MRFLNPSLFYYWAPLVLVPLILYLFRPRPKTVKTSTLPFFKWLAREHQDSAWLRWLKYLISLLLTVTVVLAGAAALGRLVVSPSAEAIKTVVILVDRSASMGAKDPEGVTRLAAALEEIDQRVDGLTAGVGVVVIAYDQRPEVLLARSVDRRKVQRALASVEVRPVAGNEDVALNLAQRLARLETPATIWHVTDHAVDETNTSSEDSASETNEEAQEESADPEETPSNVEQLADPDSKDKDLSVEHLNFALAEPVNVGITALDMRRLPLERASFEAFVQLHASGTKPVKATLDVLLDDREVDLRTVELKPGGKETLLVEIRADEDSARIVKLRVQTDGDTFATDDIVFARIPQLRPIKVLWVSKQPDPYTELALSSMGVDNDLEVFQASPDAWPPKEPVDVAILDDWLPEEWPESGSIIVINPPQSAGPVKAVRLKSDGIPMADLRSTREGHPLLYGIATARVEVLQTAVLQADGPLQPLWIGTQGPVLLAGEAQGQRIAVLGFNPQQSSQLPYLASYPLLIGNAIYWAAGEQLEEIRGMNRRTGELLELDGKELTWLDPDKPDTAIKTVALEGRSVEMNRVGLWRTDSGLNGSAALLSVKETVLAQNPAVSAADEAASATAASLFRGDLAPLLIFTVLFILVLESWLYHRCITN